MSLFLIGALGLAIDGGQMYAQRQMAQAAADAAAQAGIMSILKGTNISSANPFGTGSNPASYTCTTTDGITPCVYARYNGFGGTTADTVILSYPATVSGVVLLSSAAVPAFAVSVQRTLQTGLIRYAGAPSTSVVGAKATAGITGAVSPYCIYVLDPSAQSAFNANGGLTVSASGCRIYVNSSNSDAASVTGGANVTATAIDVVGGAVINNGGFHDAGPERRREGRRRPLRLIGCASSGQLHPAPHVDESRYERGTHPGNLLRGHLCRQRRDQCYVQRGYICNQRRGVVV